MRILSLFFLFISYANAANDTYYIFQKDIEYTQQNFSVKGIKKTYDIATHFYNNKSKKLMITIHGLTDNCGYMKFIHQTVWSKGYSILCIELPGHGLSSGARADIDRIESYGNILPVILAKFQNKYESISFLAHSTGALCFLIYKLNGQGNPFNKIILLSPLIRSKHWTLTKIALPIFSLFTSTLPRRSKEDVQYQIFNTIQKVDPHYLSRINLAWVKKLKIWNESLEQIDKKFNDKVHFFFAENDEVIDNEFNILRYQELFPNGQFNTIKGAYHHLDLDPPILKTSFYQELKKALE